MMVGIETKKKEKGAFCDQFNSASKKKKKSLTELILNIFSLSGGSQQWEKRHFWKQWREVYTDGMREVALCLEMWWAREKAALNRRHKMLGLI